MRTKTGKYVEGFVIPIRKKDLAVYRKMAEWGARTWKKHGALEYFECAGADLRTKKGMGPGFVNLTKLRPNETVIFSWIVYRSKAHRDAVTAKVMAEMDKKAKQQKDMPMPFDMRRFYYGGFRVITEA